jgi:carboxylate-amine ligase
VAFGTLEVRVPDAQTTLADAGATAAAVHALAAFLAESECDEAPAPTWRIEENRWSAARYGVEGEMADLVTGEREPTRERLSRMLDELEPVAVRLGAAPLLTEARGLVQENGAIRQRRIAAERGVRGMTAWLAEAFLTGADAPLDVSRDERTG